MDPDYLALIPSPFPHNHNTILVLTQFNLLPRMPLLGSSLRAISSFPAMFSKAVC